MLSGPGEIAGQQAECPFDDRSVGVGVFHNPSRDDGRTARAAAQYMDKIVGILPLAAITARQSFQHRKRGGTAHRYGATSPFTGERVAIQVKLYALLEGQLEPGRDDRAEVALQGLYAKRRALVRSRWDQEVDRHLQTSQGPALDGDVALGISVRCKALLSQPPSQPGVALVVEHSEGQADVEIVGAGVCALSTSGLPYWRSIKSGGTRIRLIWASSSRSTLRSVCVSLSSRERSRARSSSALRPVAQTR